jgi:hypothetical protein
MNTDELAIIKLIGKVAALENEIAMKLTKFEKLQDRVAELELIVAENRRPPSRLGSAIRWIVENQEAIREIVAKHQSSAT